MVHWQPPKTYTTTSNGNTYFWFDLAKMSLLCLKTKLKIRLLTNHNRCRQSNEPIIMYDKHTQSALNAGKQLKESEQTETSNFP